MIQRDQYDFVTIPESVLIDGGTYPNRDAAHKEDLRGEDLCFLYEGAYRRHELLTHGLNGPVSHEPKLDFTAELSAAQFRTVASAVSNVLRRGDASGAANYGYRVGLAIRDDPALPMHLNASYADVCNAVLIPPSESAGMTADEIYAVQPGAALEVSHIQRLFDALDGSSALNLLGAAAYGNMTPSPPDFVAHSYNGGGGIYPSIDRRATSIQWPFTMDFAGLREYGDGLKVFLYYHGQYHASGGWEPRVAWRSYSVPLSDSAESILSNIADGVLANLDSALAEMNLLPYAALPVGVEWYVAAACFFFTNIRETARP